MGMLLLITGLITLLQLSYLLAQIVMHAGGHGRALPPYGLMSFLGFGNSDIWELFNFIYLVLPIQIGLFCLAAVQIRLCIGLYRKRAWVYKWLGYWLLFSLLLNLFYIFVQSEFLGPSTDQWQRGFSILGGLSMLFLPGRLGLFDSFLYRQFSGSSALGYVLAILDQCWPQLIILFMLLKPSIRKHFKSWASDQPHKGVSDAV